MNEKEPKIADSKAHFVAILQALQIAPAGLDEPMKRVQNPHGHWLIEGANIGFGLIRPKDLLQAVPLKLSTSA